MLTILLSSRVGSSDPSGFCLSIAEWAFSFSPARSCRWLSASARPFSFLGVCTILNLNCPKASNHRAFLGVSFFVVVKRRRFL